MIDWQALALIAMIQHELNLQAAGEYKRIRIFERHNHWVLPIEKELSYFAFDGECLPIQPTFEVDRVELKRKEWFYGKRVSSMNNGIFVYGMLIGVSHKCQKVVYYLNEPYLWELVRR